MEHLVIRTVDDEKRIYLGDISVLMIETTAVSLTAYLVSELVRNKIKTIFCDNLHNPLAEVMPFYGSYDTSGKLRQQIRWGEAIKANVWREIVRAKIINQSNENVERNPLHKSMVAILLGFYIMQSIFHYVCLYSRYGTVRATSHPHLSR